MSRLSKLARRTEGARDNQQEQHDANPDRQLRILVEQPVLRGLERRARRRDQPIQLAVFNQRLRDRAWTHGLRRLLER